MKSQKVATPNRALKHAIVDDAQGRTQRAIASAAEIDETRLSRILSGQAIVTKEERRALARELRRPQRDLFPKTAIQQEALAS